jgi:hypothetical protein
LPRSCLHRSDPSFFRCGRTLLRRGPGFASRMYAACARKPGYLPIDAGWVASVRGWTRACLPRSCATCTRTATFLPSPHPTSPRLRAKKANPPAKWLRLPNRSRSAAKWVASDANQPRSGADLARNAADQASYAAEEVLISLRDPAPRALAIAVSVVLTRFQHRPPAGCEARRGSGEIDRDPSQLPCGFAWGNPRHSDACACIATWIVVMGGLALASPAIRRRTRPRACRRRYSGSCAGVPTPCWSD